MHFPYNNTLYALCDFSPLSIIDIDSLISNSFPLFSDVQLHPPYFNPSGLILNYLSLVKFFFYFFILNPVFWI